MDKYFTYLILGAGPSGLSVLDELISSGVNSADICILSSDISLHTKKIAADPKVLKRDVREVVERTKTTKGLKVSSTIFSKTNTPIESLSKYWGASCFPPPRWDLDSRTIDFERYKSCFGKTMKMFNVQAHEHDERNGIFSITGESIGQLRRKSAAVDFVKKSQLMHSRLALATQADDYFGSCRFHGTCFHDCPEGAIWNPNSALLKMTRQHRNLNTMQGTVESICMDNRKVTGDFGTLRFKNLYLALGAINSQKIIQDCFQESYALDASPVVMYPVLLQNIENANDYDNSFAFADLVLPKTSLDNLTSFTQIYLPTKEITGRMISALPSIMREAALFVNDMGLHRFMKRVGIAMTFLNSQEMGSSVNYRHHNIELKSVMRYLRKANLRPISIVQKKLELQESFHYGAIHRKMEVSKGIDSSIFSSLKEKSVYLADTTALPTLYPGPHTAMSAALSRYIAQDSLQGD